jgi:hypothetical protein
MISARLESIDKVGSLQLVPFLEAYHTLPITQDPQLAKATAGAKSLLLYSFYKGELPIGYAILQVKKHILAEVFHGPMVLEKANYLPSVDALKKALRKKGLLILRVLPPFGLPRPRGFLGRFNWSTCVVDVSMTQAELLQSFSPNHRQSIKKGLTAGIRIEQLKASEELEFANGYVQMFARKGVAVSLEATTALLRQLDGLGAGHSQAFVLAARPLHDDALVGGGIFLISGNTCTYYQGWSARTSPPLPVLHTLLWHAMLHARESGCRHFDLSGYSHDLEDAALKSINDFKRWFRGQLLHYPLTSVIPLYKALSPLVRLLIKRL